MKFWTSPKNCVLSLCRKLNFFWVSLSVSPPLDIFIFSHFLWWSFSIPYIFPSQISPLFAILFEVEGWIDFSPVVTSPWISSMNGLSFSDLKPQYISLGLQGLGCLILLISFYSKTSFLSLILFRDVGKQLNPTCYICVYVYIYHKSI